MRTSDIQTISSDLLGRPVVAVDRVAGGRNSQVFKLTCDDSTQYALKLYPQDGLDDRDRLGTEFSGLRFLWDNGVRCIPRPVVADNQFGYGVYEFIDGFKILPDEVKEAEIDEAVRFLSQLNGLKQRNGSTFLPVASEACFSPEAIAANIAIRLWRLRNIGCTGPQYDELWRFLTDEFEPLRDKVVGWYKENLDETVIPFASELPHEHRTLSPSDFGFHNALNRAGEIVFLDFEYFGWDDPAKTLSDFLLHPAMPLPEDLRRRFVANFLTEFQDEGPLARRFLAVYPMFGLKWCLILLNEFIPQSMHRRELARGGDVDKADLRDQQLAKSRGMLARVAKEYQDFPYYD